MSKAHDLQVGDKIALWTNSYALGGSRRKGRMVLAEVTGVKITTVEAKGEGRSRYYPMSAAPEVEKDWKCEIWIKRANSEHSMRLVSPDHRWEKIS